MQGFGQIVIWGKNKNSFGVQKAHTVNIYVSDFVPRKDLREVFTKGFQFSKRFPHFIYLLFSKQLRG